MPEPGSLPATGRCRSGARDASCRSLPAFAPQPAARESLPPPARCPGALGCRAALESRHLARRPERRCPFPLPACLTAGRSGLETDLVADSGRRPPLNTVCKVPAIQTAALEHVLGRVVGHGVDDLRHLALDPRGSKLGGQPTAGLSAVVEVARGTARAELVHHAAWHGRRAATRPAVRWRRRTAISEPFPGAGRLGRHEASQEGKRRTVTHRKGAAATRTALTYQRRWRAECLSIRGRPEAGMKSGVRREALDRNPALG
jgi:hypothetical protein